MNNELILKIKENIYKKLESLIGTKLVTDDSVDNNIYTVYRKIIVDEFRKYEDELSEMTNEDYIDLVYKLHFIVGENRIIEDITVVFKSPDFIADYQEIE